MLGMLPLFLVASASVAAAQDKYNQCYFGENLVGPQDLLPCLLPNQTERTGGVSWCCFAGDNCVNQGCWDPDTAVTYQYGCNDPTYKHENCPLKGGLDVGKSPWVGLVQCNDTSNEGRLKYWACNHPDTCGKKCPPRKDNPQSTQSVWPWTIQPLPPLPDFCNDLGTTVNAMYAPTTLGSTGAVPETFTPETGKPSPTRPPVKSSDAIPTSLSYTIMASETSSSASPTSTPTEAAEEGGAALSGGAIAGIAVGATLAGVGILAAAFFLFRRRRAKKQAGGDVPPTTTQNTPGTGPTELPPIEKRNLMVPNTPSTVSENGIKRPVSDMSFTNSSPSPMSTPRTPASPYPNQAQGPYSGHAELSDDARVIHEMPAINERAEMA